MQNRQIKISDETLRDGEQQVGIFFSLPTKHKLAHLIAQTGVSGFAIMPSVCEQESELAKTLISDGLNHLITASTMMGKEYIDQAKNYGIKRIILFHALSDRLLFLRNPHVRQMSEYQGKTIDDDIPSHIINKIRQDALDVIVENLHYATKVAGLRVDFAAEDASRTDFDFLVQCINSCSPYIEHFLLCDTVGVLTPEKSYIWINDLLQSTTGVKLGVHYHNDMGLALENTLQSLIAGATLVSGTFCGLGERAGNVALEQVLNGLRVRFGIEVEGINYDTVDAVTNYIEEMGIRPAPPYSQTSQRHESGIHVNSLFRDPLSYAIFPHNKIDVAFGKWSGVSNFQYLFEKQLQNPQPRQQYEKMRAVIKSLATEQERYLTANEVLKLWKDGMFE
ncbi:MULTISPECIES: 2-isopropylmalate synthase [Cyanophyceae]|uniref:2-isopropylmalate synthase n=1 Tax=Cyanophyceae TaxID=3028117 RepID=UPI00232D5EA7|nr:MULTISPECIES: 2-isopropylmalate synthase [Cyanophyceae]MDB9357910.1 2-isopropylmalate synthase [Nodularia spumigena CS-587/03]MDB9304090.1 2-isopropylmalate synthase [Nodularia spumigena CS-591/12]MDB9319495.1 2-isopropylmalate synthase [Nodularia spumigena CS-590/01A]MDB9323100.1 2-isopropylmalate synthase [Nodularia spumigena CS-591/07A]MDB9326551.1 2-isopropylmalate synthase [Nodularia spumigena CS-590/02]